MSTCWCEVKTLYHLAAVHVVHFSLGMHVAAPTVLFADTTCRQAALPCNEDCAFVQQSRGADPTIKTEDYDPYLNPGPKTPLEVRLSASSCCP